MRSVSDVSWMLADVAFFLYVLCGRFCHGGLCQGKHRSYCTEVSGSRRPSTSKSDSVSAWLSRAMFCFVRRKYGVVQRQLCPPRNSFALRHFLYRRRPVPTKCRSSSSMSSSSRSSRTSVSDRGLMYVLSPMEFRSASSEGGADERLEGASVRVDAQHAWCCWRCLCSC